MVDKEKEHEGPSANENWYEYIRNLCKCLFTEYTIGSELERESEFVKEGEGKKREERVRAQDGGKGRGGREWG